MSSRFEDLVTALINGETVDLEPRSRMEQYLKNCIDKTGSEGLPIPRARAEILLYQLAEQLEGGTGGSTGTGGSVEGTAIPVGKKVDKIYFNTALPYEEIKSYLSQLTYVDIGVGHPVNLIYVEVDEELNGHILFAFEMVEGVYFIGYKKSISGDGTYILFSHFESPFARGGWYKEELWQITQGTDEHTGDLQVNELHMIHFPHFSVLTDFNGAPIGLENEKIKNVLSITPFGASGTSNEGSGVVIYDDIVAPYVLTKVEKVSVPNATSISDDAFRGLTSLTSIDLPNVTSIGNNAFNNCTALTSIDLPNVTSIGIGVFYNCKALTTINLPNVTSIGNSAFNNCEALTSIDLPNVTSIGNNAFNSCDALTTINLPNVISIGGGTFNGCGALTSINLPNVTSIGNSTFYGCTALTSIDLPNVISIGGATFRGCDALTSINLPNVTSIGNNTFTNCTALTSIDLPNVTSIDEYAFYSCMIKTISVPNVTSIGGYAFADCEVLTSIDLPNVTSIGECAFHSCYNFTTIILRTTETICNVNLTALLDTKIVTLEGTPTGKGFVYVPTSLYEDYVANFTEQATALLVSAGMTEEEAVVMAEQISRAVLRKIEDYPEICGAA